MNQRVPRICKHANPIRLAHLQIQTGLPPKTGQMAPALTRRARHWSSRRSWTRTDQRSRRRNSKMVTEALQELRARGFHVRVKGDKLKVSPSPVPPDVAALIKDHRDGLVAVLRGRCPVCGERLRAAIHAERFTYSECGVEPIHYAELVNRTGGKPMGVFTDYAPDGQCARC